MRVIVFDTETTGLPQSKIINPDTLTSWPHIVQFSYVVYDVSNNDIPISFDKVVKLTDGITIPEDSTLIHGITNEMSIKTGFPIYEILDKFFHSLKNADMLVGHNISFDINMVKVELLRLIYSNNFNVSEKEITRYKYNLHLLTNFTNIYCTLQESIDFCNIKAVSKYGKEYLKYPKLVELHKKLFETIPHNLHNSFNDILVTLRCFMKLKYDLDLEIECKKFKSITRRKKLF
jgi:DNA polymerase III epsilon subunit-like protein